MKDKYIDLNEDKREREKKARELELKRANVFKDPRFSVRTEKVKAPPLAPNDIR